MNLRKLIRRLLALLAFGWLSPLSAIPVIYTMEADVIFAPNTFDTAALLGAHVTWDVFADTDASASNLCCSSIADYASETYSILFTNRPDSFPDVYATAQTLLSPALTTNNRSADLFRSTATASNYITGRNNTTYEFYPVGWAISGDFWSGSGFAPLPDSIDSADVVGISGFNQIREWIGTDDYQLGNQRFSMRVVPAPATLALFGIGLVGLGWSRRKKV